MATLASLVVKIGVDSRGTKQGLETLRKNADGTRKSFGQLATTSVSLGRSLAVVAGATGTAFAAKKMFELGAAVAETASKFSTVFGPASQDVERFIANFGTMAGLSNQAAQEILATTGAIAQGMGFAQNASAQFATEIVTLAGDLSSFNNIPVAETARAIQAALTGEREQLKRMGIVVREVDVQQRAMAMSGKNNVKALTDQEKAAATFALITERAGVAVGDLARTQDSAANEGRALGAEIQNLKESIATAFLPALSVGVTGMNAFIKGLQIMGAEAAVSAAKIELAFASGGVFQSLSASIGAINRPLGALLSKLGGDMSSNVNAATANLARMEAAADAVKLDIVGLTAALNGLKTEQGEVVRTGAAMTTVLGEASTGVLGFARGANQTMTPLGVLMENIRKQFGDIRDIMPTVFDLKPSLALAALEAEARNAAETMETLRSVGVGFAMDFADAIGTAALDGAASFKRFADSVIRDLLRIAARMAIFEALNAIFPGSRFVAGLGASFGFGGARAHGGPVHSGASYLVGERGPEMFRPSTSGSVVPLGAGGGGGMADIDWSTFPAALDPISAARDSQWQRFFSETLRALDGNGGGR